MLRQGLWTISRNVERHLASKCKGAIFDCFLLVEHEVSAQIAISLSVRLFDRRFGTYLRLIFTMNLTDGIMP